MYFEKKSKKRQKRTMENSCDLVTRIYWNFFSWCTNTAVHEKDLIERTRTKLE